MLHTTSRMRLSLSLRARGCATLPGASGADVGAAAAVLFVQPVASSDFADLGGPNDWIVLLMVGGLAR